MDEIAGLMHTVLRHTSPGTTAAGAQSKASYQLEPGLSDRIRQQCSELLTGFPLYPEVVLD